MKFTGIFFVDVGTTSKGKKSSVARGLESFTVKINAEGELETISSQEENVPLSSDEVPVARPRGRPRKKIKLESNPELVAIGRVVAG